MYCYRCGNKLPQGSHFCNRCGARVSPPVDVRPDRSSTTSHSTRGEPPAVEAEKTRSSEDRPSRAAVWSDADLRAQASRVEMTGPDWEDEWSDDGEDEWEMDPVDDGVEEEVGDVRAPREDFQPSATATTEWVIFSINPAFYPVTAAYLVSTAISVILTAGLAYFNVPLLFVLVTVLTAYLPAIIRHIKHIHTIFTLTNLKIEISTGLLSKTTQNIPLRHIQDVSVRESLSERLIGIGDIIIDTPAMESNTTLDNIREPRRYADLILREIQRWG
jgi:membrane protein YdbS with pleckstrin-like domain